MVTLWETHIRNILSIIIFFFVFHFINFSVDVMNVAHCLPMNQPQSQRKHSEFNGLCKYLILPEQNFIIISLARVKMLLFFFFLRDFNISQGYEMQVNFSWTSQKFITINSLESCLHFKWKPSTVGSFCREYVEHSIACIGENLIFGHFLHSISLANQNVSQSIILSTLLLSLWNWF